MDIFEGHAAKNTFTNGHDDLTPIHQWFGDDAIKGPTIGFNDGGLLGHIDQTPGQVTRVCCFQCSVGQPLTSTMGGNKILEDPEAFSEVGLDRRLDDFARGLGHQTAHAGQLADLIPGAPGSRVRHDKDRIEAGCIDKLVLLVAHVVNLDLIHHLVGNILSCF